MNSLGGIIVSWDVVKARIVISDGVGRTETHVQHGVYPFNEETTRKLDAQRFVSDLVPADQRGVGSVCYVTTAHESSPTTPAEFAILYEPHGISARSIEEMLTNKPKLIVGQLNRHLDVVRMRYDPESGLAHMERCVPLKRKGYVSIEGTPRLYEGSIVRALGLPPVLGHTEDLAHVAQGAIRRVFADCYSATELPVDPHVARVMSER